MTKIRTVALVSVIFLVALSGPADAKSTAVKKFTPKPKASQQPLPKPESIQSAISRYEVANNIPESFTSLDPSLGSLMNQAVGTFNPYSGKYENPLPLNNLIWKYYASPYFQSHNTSQMFAEVVRVTSPCDYIKAYNDAVSYLISFESKSGINLPDVGQQEVCGSVHGYNANWPDTFYSSQKLAAGETVSDWLLHGSMYFWNNFENSILQNQYQSHPWLWFYPTSVFSRDYSSPSTWSNSSVLNELNQLPGMSDGSRLVPTLLARVN